MDGLWAHCRTLLETTGANSLQLTSYFESQFPYEFNLLAHAAVGVELHRLKEYCLAELLPVDASFLTALGNRLTARILFAMTGTSSQREREQLDTLTPTYMSNRFNGSMMREITLLHSLEPKLILPLQSHLGIAVRASINVSEIAQYMRHFQIMPDEEVSRKWLLRVQNEAQERRVKRLY